MRMLLKVVIDTEAGNELFRTGKAGEAIDQLAELLKPEAVYSTDEDGARSFFAVIDLADPSQIPLIAEPLFQQLKAKVTMTPTATLEELKKGVDELARRMPPQA
jgi:hypothetical protein